MSGGSGLQRSLTRDFSFKVTVWEIAFLATSVKLPPEVTGKNGRAGMVTDLAKTFFPATLKTRLPPAFFGLMTPPN